MPCLYLGCIQGSTVASRNSTPQEAHLFQWSLLVDLSQGNIRDDCVLRKCRCAHEMEQLFTFARESRTSIGHHTSALGNSNLLAEICFAT